MKWLDYPVQVQGSLLVDTGSHNYVYIWNFVFIWSREFYFYQGKVHIFLKRNVCVNHFPFVCAILWPGHEYPAYSFIIHFYQEQVNKQSYNEKSDIWSLGCLVYELCSLSPPFTAMNQRSLEAKIRIGKFRPIPEHYSADLSEVVNSMLRLNVSLMCSGQ